MRIEVLYFAVTRERSGLDSQVFDLPLGTTLAQLQLTIESTHPALVSVLPYVRFAVNEAFERDLERPLTDGDVIALIPPVSGGNSRFLSATPLEPRELEDEVMGPDCGGLVTFSGRVRNHTGEHGVTQLNYEAYGPMAEKVLSQLLTEVCETHPSVRITLRHRIGTLAIGDTAVIIAAAAPHRKAAFDACQLLIDRLKEDVPIFKKEFRGDGSIWVGMGP